MDKQIIKSLKEFVGEANMLLNNKIISAYCFGSAVYGDFHEGYSDLDFFIIVDRPISEEDFQRFSLWRSKLRSSNHPHLSVLEGEIISKDAIDKEIESNVIYWGTSKDRLKRKYGLAGFSLRGLIDKGYLVYGEELREQLPYPDHKEMLGEVDHMIDTIEKYAQVTDEDIHSEDWLFLISQSIYWVKTSDTTGKTNAAKWVLNNCNYSWLNILEKAIEIRELPILAKTEENKEWLKSLGPIVQEACKTLRIERNRFVLKLS